MAAANQIPIYTDVVLMVLVLNVSELRRLGAEFLSWIPGSNSQVLCVVVMMDHLALHYL
jgi:hypothetical protein